MKKKPKKEKEKSEITLESSKNPKKPEIEKGKQKGKKKKKFSTKNLKNKKKMIIVAIVIAGIVFSSVGVGFWIFQAGLFGGEEADYDFQAEVGDIYYTKIQDGYYWLPQANKNDTTIEEYAMVLRQEILEKKDSSIDLDDDPDLLLLSSILFGEEIELLGEEFGVYMAMPNYFDIVNLMILGFDVFQFLKTNLEINETLRLFTPEVPSAIHLVTTGIYHEIEALIENYGVDEFADLPTFENINYILNWFESLSDQIKGWKEDFEGVEGMGGIGYDINEIRFNRMDDWTYQTQFPDTNKSDGILQNNSASLFEREGDWGIMMYQDANASTKGIDDLTLRANIYDTYVSKANWSKYVAKDRSISETYFNPDKFAFEMDYLYGNNISNPTHTPHTFEADFTTKHFDISGNIGNNPQSFNFSGENGIKIRIENGILQYEVGDYIYVPTESGGFSTGGFFRETTPEEKGWHNCSTSFNLTQWFGIDSGCGSTFTIETTPNFQSDASRFLELITAFFTGDRSSPFTYDLKVKSEFGTHYSKSKIPLYIDCPYDFAHAYDNIKDKDNVLFRMNNITEVKFKMYDSLNLENYTLNPINMTSDWIDDVEVNGMIFASDENFVSLMDDWLYTQLAFLSIFHTMLFPKQFQWETISIMVQIMNNLLIWLTGMENPIKIKDTTNQLRVEIPYSAVLNITYSLIYLIMDMAEEYVDFEVTQYPCDIDYKFVINFDKRIGTLNESYMEMKYTEFNILRKVGLELIAVSDKNGVAKYEGIYPSFDELIQGTLDEATEMVIIGLITTSFITAGSSIGIVELIRYIRKRRKLPKTKSEKKSLFKKKKKSRVTQNEAIIKN